MMIAVQGMESHVKDKMSGDHWELCQINIGKQPFLRFISKRTEMEFLNGIFSRGFWE
jgi:hypothetical protein